MDIKDRIKLIMEREQLTAGAFANAIGVSPATISHILGGRNKIPSTEVILLIHHRYPDIHLEWLMTGEGEMSKETATGWNRDEESISDLSLAAENADFASYGTDSGKKRKEMPVQEDERGGKSIVKQEIIYKERPPRKITEIRIFFDDNTYETFRPER